MPLQLVDGFLRIDIAVASRDFKPSRLCHLRCRRLPPLDLRSALSTCPSSAAGRRSSPWHGCSAVPPPVFFFAGRPSSSGRKASRVSRFVVLRTDCFATCRLYAPFFPTWLSFVRLPCLVPLGKNQRPYPIQPRSVQPPDASRRPPGNGTRAQDNRLVRCRICIQRPVYTSNHFKAVEMDTAHRERHHDLPVSS